MKNIKGIGVLSAFIGMILYKIFGHYYGDSGQKLVAYIGLSICFIALLSLVLMKQFLIAILCSMIVLPGVAIVIGMYLDNLLVVVGGLVLLLIMLFILIKIYKK